MKTSLLSLLLAVSLFCAAHEGGNFVSSDMLASMKPGEKAALLMVHFGTTHDDTRAQTIDAVNAQARKAFPDLEFREAYTSRIIIRRLKARGIDKPTPLDALLQLRGEGYTHIIVQSTNIIDGVEMESLRRDVESVLPFFKEIRVGTPLLYSVEDAEKVAVFWDDASMLRYGRAPRKSPKSTSYWWDTALIRPVRCVQSNGLYAESGRIRQLPCGDHRRLSHL